MIPAHLGGKKFFIIFFFFLFFLVFGILLVYIYKFRKPPTSSSDLNYKMTLSQLQSLPYGEGVVKPDLKIASLGGVVVDVQTDRLIIKRLGKEVSVPVSGNTKIWLTVLEKGQEVKLEDNNVVFLSGPPFPLKRENPITLSEIKKDDQVFINLKEKEKDNFEVVDILVVRNKNE